MTANDTAPPPRFAIYARFSPGPTQGPQSIEDQIMLCRRRAEHLGGVVAGTYSDAELTGQTMREPKVSRASSSTPARAGSTRFSPRHSTA